MNNIKKMICFSTVIFPALLSSCSDKSEQEDYISQAALFGVCTRADSDSPIEGTTYRINSYGSSYSKYAGGTFILQNAADNELTPCALDDDGNPLPDGTIANTINRFESSFRLFVVSPGVKDNSDGSFNFTLGDETKLYCSEQPENISLGGYGKIIFSKKLKDYKAKIGFHFYKSKNETVDDFSIENVSITGAGKPGETVILHPARRQVVADPNSKYPVTCSFKKDSNITDNEGNPLYYETAEEDMATIIPGIYAPKDKVAEILGISTSLLRDSYPLTMLFRLKQGNRDHISIQINLTSPSPQIKPQNIYIYNIIVSSNFLHITADVYEDNETPDKWDTVSNETEEISATKTINLGSWEIVDGSNDDKWQTESLEEQNIE